MNTNVIERNVVEFGFDNSDFEQKTKESMSTIEKLKASLKFDKSDALKGLSDAANNVNLNGLSSTLEMIQSKFNTLGIVGMTTISRLTNELISGVMRAGKAIDDAIVTGGKNRALNIERAKFQLKGLGIAWDDVSHAVNYAVTDTAYSLDAAAQAAAQLATSGLDYEKVIFTHEKDKEQLTEMAMALKGISGVAAQTGKDFQLVAGYFQDVSNAGKVTGSTLTYMTQVLNLPVEQNIAEGLKAIADGSYEATDAVKANAKKLVSSYEITTESIKDLAKKGLIDFDTFSTIMFNKYADHAAAANETYDGVIANIRSAFAKIGAEFYGPLIQNEGPLVKMLDAIRAKINAIKGEIIPLATVVTDFINELFVKGEQVISNIDVSGMFDNAIYAVDELIKAVKVVFPEIKKIFSAIRDTYKNIFPKKTTDSFKKAIDKITSSIKKFKVSGKSLDKIKSIFSGIFSVGQLAIKVIKNILQNLKPLLPYGKRVLTWITDVAAKIGDAITAVNKGTTAIKGLEDSAEHFTYAFNNIKNIFKGAFDILTDSTDHYRNVFEKILDIIVSGCAQASYAILQLISAFTGIDTSSLDAKLEDFWMNFGDKIRNFFDLVEENGGGFKGLANTIWDTLKELGKKFANWVKETTGIDLFKLKEKVEECAEKVKESFSGFLDEFQPLEKARDIVISLTEAIVNLAETVKHISGSIGTGLGKLIENPFVTLEALSKSQFMNQIILIAKRVSNQGLAATLSGLAGPISSLQGALLSFQKSMNAQQLMTISAAIIGFSVAVGVLAHSVEQLASIKEWDKVLMGVAMVFGLMVGLLITVITAVNLTSSTFKKSSTTFGKAVNNLLSVVKTSVVKIAAVSIAFLAIAAAVKKMAEAVVEISKIDFGPDSEKMLDALIIIVGSLAALTLEFIALQNIISGMTISARDILKILLVSEIFNILAAATKSMTEAVAIIQNLNSADWKMTILSVIEVLGLLVALVAVLNHIMVPNIGGFIKSAVSLLIICIAVSELVNAINKLNAQDPWETLISFGLVLLALEALMSNAFMLSGRAISLKTSFGLLAIATSMAILCKQIQKLAAMPITSIAKGFLSLYGILAGFSVIAVLFKEQMPGMIQAGIAMIAFAEAIKIVAKAIDILAKLNIADVALNLSLLIVSMYTMTKLLEGLKNEDTLTGALAMMTLAGSLYIVANALKLLAGLPWKETATNGLILLGVLTAMSLVAAKMEGNFAGAATLFVVAAAILAVGAALKMIADAKEWAFAAVGAIFLLVGALGILAALSSTVAPYLVVGGVAIAAFMTLIAVGVASVSGSLLLLGVAVGQIAASVAGASEGLALLAESLIKVGTVFVMYKDPISQFTATLFKMVAITFTLGAGLAVAGVGAATAAVGFAALAIAGLALAAAIAAIGAALSYTLPKINSDLANGIKDVEPVMEGVGEGITKSIAKGMIGNTPIVKDASKQVANEARNSFNNELGIASPSQAFMESGKFIDMGLAEGITGNQDLVKKASEVLGKTASDSLTTSISQGTANGTKVLEGAVKQFSVTTQSGAVAAGQQVGNGFMKGLNAIAPKVKQYAANLGRSAYLAMKQYLKIKSPSRLMMELGEYTGEGFVIGMQNTETNVEDSAQDLGKTATDSLTTALSAAYDNLTSGMEDPTIKPVLDLSEIQNGASSIDSMLSRDVASSISANYKSDRDYTAEQSQANASLMSGLNDKLVSALMANGGSDLPINLNVQLVGDAAGIFRLVQAENVRLTNMYGSSPLMRG